MDSGPLEIYIQKDLVTPQQEPRRICDGGLAGRANIPPGRYDLVRAKALTATRAVLDSQATPVDSRALRETFV